MSVYIRKYEILFHHIPRTGGTWVNKVLEQVFGTDQCDYLVNRAVRGVPKSHPLLSHIVHTKRFKPRDVFTFVRHPFGFYESVWLTLRSKRRRRVLPRKFAWHPLAPGIDLWDNDFKTWVQAMCDQRPAWYARLLDLYVGPAGAEFCGFVGRTESLREDLFGYLSGIDGTLDLPALCRDVPRANVSERTGGIEWPAHLQTAVQRSEHEVFERFYK